MASQTSSQQLVQPKSWGRLPLRGGFERCFFIVLFFEMVVDHNI